MLSSKSKNKPRLNASFGFWGIGTQWQVTLYDAIDGADFIALQQAVAERVEAFDQAYSRFRADSLVSRIAQKAGRYDMSNDFTALYGFYKKLYDVTDGAVTPLIGQTLSDLGYDANYSLRSKSSIASVPTWANVMDFADGVLTTKQPVLLDFGAAGKGYLVDLIATLMKQHDVVRYCIDASGDILYENRQQPIKIGLEDPTNSSQAIGVAEVTGGSICGSAGNRRRWGGLNHIIDPVSQNSSTDISATWVMAKSALQADGLATALFFTDPAKLRQAYDFEFVRVHSNGTAEISQQFSGQLFGAD